MVIAIGRSPRQARTQQRFKVRQEFRRQCHRQSSAGWQQTSLALKLGKPPFVLSSISHGIAIAWRPRPQTQPQDNVQMDSPRMTSRQPSFLREAARPLPRGLAAEAPPRMDHAYVTLVSNPDYLPGAEALLRSLRLTGTRADLVVMHRGLTPAHLARLRALGARLIAADLLPTSAGFDTTHARDALHKRAAFTRGGKPDFHTPLDNFVKLRLWQLDYERCVFIDADAVVLRPVDKLFELPEFCAAPNVYDGLDGFHRMNSGVFTACPDPRTFRDMLARLDRPGVFWRRTDQTFLQDYF